MDDDSKLLEVDDRVRKAVTPPEAAVDRVVLRALGDGLHAHPRRRRLRFVAATVAAFVLLLVAVIWQRTRTTSSRPAPPSLAITGEGSILIVESQDGRRWVVGPAPARHVGGNYVIVVPE